MNPVDPVTASVHDPTALLVAVLVGLLLGLVLGVVLERSRSDRRRAPDAQLPVAAVPAPDASATLRAVVGPLERQLSALDEHVRELERERQGAYSGLRRELGHLHEAQRELHGTARDLERALRSSGGRGRWGEVQLRRIVELAGLIEHVDFAEQPTIAGGLRPDLIVLLPGGGAVPVDAKAPMDAYFRALDEDDPTTRRALLGDHLVALERRAAELGSKEYWRRLDGSADFVVLFLPVEGCLSAAFEHDPALLDRCLERRVLPATPITLLALLKTIAWGWRRQTADEGAERIVAAGRELHERLTRFLDHLQRTGRGLHAAVDAYNRSIGSLERRVMPSVRRLESLAAADDTVEPPEPLTTAPRAVAATESGRAVAPTAAERAVDATAAERAGAPTAAERAVAPTESGRS